MNEMRWSGMNDVDYVAKCPYTNMQHSNQHMQVTMHAKMQFKVMRFCRICVTWVFWPWQVKVLNANDRIKVPCNAQNFFMQWNAHNDHKHFRIFTMISNTCEQQSWAEVVGVSCYVVSSPRRIGLELDREDDWVHIRPDRNWTVDEETFLV